LVSTNAIVQFLFEPLRLKSILDWPQQELIVKEFECIAAMNPHDAPVELQPYMAAFYLFQCHLTEFGVAFNAEKICHWLSQATEPDDAGGICYYAQAWIWRISNTFGVLCPKSLFDLESYFKLSIMRGHRTCIADGDKIIEKLRDSDSQKKWRLILNEGLYFLNTMSAGLGMPYFAPRKLRRSYNLNNLQQLDTLIKEELGQDYDSCLRINQMQVATAEGESKESDEAPKKRNFESIFVNHIGHGLLHYAASSGNAPALRHMIEKYHVNLNVADQAASETPLVCACRSGHFECAMVLLETGASPNQSQFGAEPPLSWLCSFKREEMSTIAQKLVNTGAVVDGGGTYTLRPDVRPIWADWENLLSISVTPLGRAVVMNNLEAVEVLLGHGANPLARPDRKKSEPGKCAIELAAVLNIPEILEVLILYLRSEPVGQARIFDEGEMLQAAHNKSIVPFDTTSLQSRVVRHGSRYKLAMFTTLQLLHKNRAKHINDWKTAGTPRLLQDFVLCQEVKLGNVDIVEHLIELGHPANGSPGHRPLEEAVKLNHDTIFRVLIGQGANIFVKHGLENGSQLSLLQICAERPKTARPGTFIAEYLIKGGIPVDPLQDGARSAFALAVLNQDFELASLLLSYGANVNYAYQPEQWGPWITVLGELARTHTERSLRSIEYLLSLGKPSIPEQLSNTSAPETQFNQLSLSSTHKPQAIPDFIVDKTNQLSILHILARCPPETTNNTAQISVRIINIILKAFKDPNQLNYTHPIYGTALCLAAVTLNLNMVTTLLDLKARADLGAFPSQFPTSMGLKLRQIVEPAIPKHLALAVLLGFFMDLQGAVAANSLPAFQGSLETSRDNLTILELLISPDDMTDGGEGGMWGQFQALRVQMKSHMKGMSATEGGWKEGEGNLPVDLLGLNEFEVLPWKDGDEMNSEQAMATMLKYMR
jgi:ankyrin repeat protein